MLSLRVLSFSGQEDIDEILEQILASKADSLSLVFPRKAYIFEQKTDLQKLRDKSDAAGKDITIITLNARARKEIQSVGISSVPTLVDNEKTPFEKSKNEREDLKISYIPIDTERKKYEIDSDEKEVNPFLSKPTLHSLFFLIAIFCVLFFFILQIAVPAANIVITPEKKEEEMHINVYLLDETVYEESDLWEKNNAIFMIPLSSTFVHEGRFTNVSKKFYGENAKGTLQLINRTDEDITLKKGTKIEHKNGLVVKLPEWIKIPAQGNIIIGFTMPPEDPYGTIVGERGNLEKGEKFIIPGLPDEMQKDIYAQVDTHFEGGVNVWKYYIKKNDFERAKKTWEKEARAKVDAEIKLLFAKLKTETEKDYLLISPTETAIDFEVLDSQFLENPEDLIGKEQGYIDGKIQVRIKTYVYSQSALLELIRNKYQRLAPDGMELKSIDETSLLASIQKVNDEKTEIKANFSTRGFYEYYLEPKSDRSRLFLMQVKQSIMGEKKDIAIEQLVNNFNPIAEVEIELSPFWVRRLPLIPEKIVINIHSSEE